MKKASLPQKQRSDAKTALGRDDEGSPDIDELVEDLSQQNVLPSHNGAALDDDESGDDHHNIQGGLDETGRWDEPVGERGHRAARAPLEDEVAYAEKLVTGGLNEADEELRDLDENDLEDDEREDNDDDDDEEDEIEQEDNR